LEFVAGIDEEIGFAGAGLGLTRLLCGVFESADRGGADGYDAAGLAARLTDLRGGFDRNRIGLGVQHVLFDLLDTNWLEGTESDVEGDFRRLDAAVAEAGKNFRSEVEAGGGCGDGSALAGVDGLVAVAIDGGIGAGDVGRERDVADCFHACEEVVHRGETDVALAKLAAGSDLGLEFVVLAEEKKMLADADFAAWTDKAFPIVWIGSQPAGQQDFDTAAEEVARGWVLRAERLGLKAGAASKKAGGKYAGVVEYQQITGVEEVGKIAKVAAGESAGGGGEMQEAGAGAIGQRLLGD
jgi:hypothetical protein